MKVKWITAGAGILMLAFILLMGYQSAIAAPAGELTIVSPMIGNEVPVPWEEQAHANDYMKFLYDPVVGTTPDAKGSTKTGLAEKWEMSPDGMTWTFTIRRGVKFHDGVELTAKDVKFTMEMDMGPGSKSHNAGTLKAVVKSIEVKDPYTLVVQCKKPYLFLPEGLLSDISGPGASVVPKEAYERVGRDTFLQHPIGSGPYKFHSQQVGSFIKFEATEKHWRDGVPRYKYVTFRIIPEEGTQIAMLKTGQADIARIGRESAKDLLGEGFNVISKKNQAIVIFMPNMTWESPAFSDLRFRKALNLAIDKEAIIKHIFAGRARPTTSFPGATIFGVKNVPTLKPYPYSPDEAKRLIKDAGFEGFEFTVPSYVRPGGPEIPRLVEAVCGYWEKIGLKPKIFNIAWPQYGEMRRNQKTKGHMMPSNDMTCSALSELVMLFRENLHSSMPRTLIKDPKADEMIDRVEKSLDRAEVEKLVIDLYRYTYDNHFYVAICDIDDEIAISKKVPPWDPGLRRVDRNYNDIIRQR
jgi:peptide/nickel transport system substrate-binding protein